MISVKALANQEYVSYDSHAAGRRIADEEWAEEVYINPGVRLNVTCVHYAQEGYNRADFHIFPEGPINSIKGDIRNCISNDEIQVNHQNIILHMNPLKDQNTLPRLEVIVNRVAQ